MRDLVDISRIISEVANEYNNSNPNSKFEVTPKLVQELILARHKALKEATKNGDEFKYGNLGKFVLMDKGIWILEYKNKLIAEGKTPREAIDTARIEYFKLYGKRASKKRNKDSSKS
jgi:hypothetical protein